MGTIDAESARAQAALSWSHHPFIPSPCAFFSWALFVSYNVVEYACVSILITFYTQEAMQDRLAEAALLLCLQEGLACFTAILLVRFTRERFGRRFYAIVISTASYIAGIMILWSYARQSAQETNLPLFLVVSFLFALGKGGADPPLKSFLGHNLSESYNIRSIESQQSKHKETKSAEIYKNIWVQSAWILGATVGIFGFLGLQWVRVFQISSIIMVLSGLLFLLCGNGSRPFDQSVLDRDATTVPKRVRYLKWVLMFSCIAYSLVLSTGNIFFQEQGSKMEPLKIKGKEVRFSVMIVIKSAVNEITILIYVLCGVNKKQGMTLVRIGAGMVCAVICCVIAWKVEIERKKVANIDEEPKTSVAWLSPHYALLGLVEGLAQSGLEELLAHEDGIETLRNPGRLSKDMVSCVGKILGIPCILVVRRWFENFDKDEAHLDRYYFMLAILSWVFFCIYLGVAYLYMKVVPCRRS
ncbi:protein NRT1/ PTR FAMILY 5.11-like [Prosopis cineraria]|uniref:protein NRT1/ PTR FAMILY 5.11-like n=1 Tax=Prosopis cineraria TaxID=364024 RepID=UPI00240EA2A4|nr:protein NRT1/ PTR FAMILY 5.11-like [Prosopis cineraria]